MSFNSLMSPFRFKKNYGLRNTLMYKYFFLQINVKVQQNISQCKSEIISA